VVLVTPFEVTLRRARQDPDRGRSKDVTFLEADHARFQDGLPHLAGDLVLDGAEATATALARQVIATSDGRRSSGQ
jgi:hypothetical protein